MNKDSKEFEQIDWVDEVEFEEFDEVNWAACPTCGQENHEDDLQWCESCGTRLSYREDEDELEWS